MQELKNLNEYYQRLAKTISSQLQLETPNHDVTTGTSREFVWLHLFEKIIPKKFKIARSVFIIDSYGEISAEVDIAIFDEEYTPYVFNYGEMQFIPIEAVAAVVQSKSRSMKKDILDNVTAWAQTIYKLKPVLNACARTHHGFLDTSKITRSQSQTSTRPIFILCTLHSLKTEERNDDISSVPELKRNFDFILHLDKEQQFQFVADEKKSFAKWYEELNHYDLKRYNSEYKKLANLSPINFANTNEKFKQCAEKDNIEERKLKDLKIYTNKSNKEAESNDENPLLTFMFQFNQLLMIINNPMFFPHQAYVNMFNDAIKKKRKRSV